MDMKSACSLPREYSRNTSQCAEEAPPLRDCRSGVPAFLAESLAGDRALRCVDSKRRQSYLRVARPYRILSALFNDASNC
jgi:hypothetical protein